MPTYDPRVDDYIKKAKPELAEILTHLRELVHMADPEITESIKWGAPHFEWNGIVCGMAAFKNHAGCWFWKAKLLKDPKGILQVAEKHSMGNFDKMLTVADLPPDKAFIDFVKQAAKLNQLR